VNLGPNNKQLTYLHFFARSFVLCPFVRSFVRSFVRLFGACLFATLLNIELKDTSARGKTTKKLFVRSVATFINIKLQINPLAGKQLKVHSFTRSFVRSFVRLFVWSLVRSQRHKYWIKGTSARDKITKRMLNRTLARSDMRALRRTHARTNKRMQCQKLKFHQIWIK
jgi:hypothetical protein